MEYIVSLVLYIWVAVLVIAATIIGALLLKNGEKGKGIAFILGILLFIPLSLQSVEEASLFLMFCVLLSVSGTVGSFYLCLRAKLRKKKTYKTS